MKIIAINSSPRKPGSLSSLVEEACRGARDKGARVEEVRLAELNIGYCRFCMTCFRDPDSQIGRCVQDDDMKQVLTLLKEADGYIMASQVSSGHANAIFKTFIERCTYTAGTPKRKVLWIKGIPTPRFTDRQRFAVTIVTAGGIPGYFRVFCNTATRQMKELGSYVLNARVTGSLYAGSIHSRGLRKKHLKKAYRLGASLPWAIEKAAAPE